MPLFILPLLLLILTGCESTPSNPFFWYKDGANQEDFSKYNYTCLQQSQQKISTVDNDTHIEVYGTMHHFAGDAEEKMITNKSLYRACMNAHGWYLKEFLQQ